MTDREYGPDFEPELDPPKGRPRELDWAKVRIRADWSVKRIDWAMYDGVPYPVWMGAVAEFNAEAEGDAADACRRADRNPDDPRAVADYEKTREAVEEMERHASDHAAMLYCWKPEVGVGLTLLVWNAQDWKGAARETKANSRRGRVLMGMLLELRPDIVVLLETGLADKPNEYVKGYVEEAVAGAAAAAAAPARPHSAAPAAVAAAGGGGAAAAAVGAAAAAVGAAAGGGPKRRAAGDADSTSKRKRGAGPPGAG
jgi:hypothetical protein